MTVLFYCQHTETVTYISHFFFLTKLRIFVFIKGMPATRDKGFEKKGCNNNRKH